MEEKLLSQLSENILTEKLQLSVMQGLISAEISMKRQELGMSRKEFAEKAHVSQSTVLKWESGDCNYSLLTLVHIASILGMELQIPFSRKEDMNDIRNRKNV